MHICRYIVLFATLSAQGQEVSPLGRFSVDYTSGCAPLTVNVTELDPFGAIDRQYFYEAPGNTVATTSLTHTYNTPGTYKLVQLVGAAVTPNTDTLTIVVYEPALPDFDYYLCDNREVQVVIDDPTYDTYEVEFAGSTQVSLLDGQSTSYTFAPADPLTISVRGQYTGTPDNCGQSSLTLPAVNDALLAPAVNFVEIRQVCEDTYALSLNADFDENTNYEIEWSLDGGAYSTLANDLLTSPLVFPDVSFPPATSSYCVRVNVVNTCDASRQLGTPECVNLNTNDLAPIRNLYSTYAGNSIAIVLHETDLGTFRFERSFDGANYSQIHSGNTSFTDTSPFLGRQYQYRISYLDTCGGTWGTQPTQPPFVKATSTGVNRYLVEFDPPVHHDGLNFSYSAFLNETPIPFTGNSFEINLTPEGGNRQPLYIQGVDGSTSVISNTVQLTYEFQVGVPKAFTPNGDGLNDRLEVFGLNGVEAELRIYTRWGQQVHREISTAPSWDGRVSGQMADEGVYVYEISIPGSNNRRQKGTFVLIKN